MLDKNLSPEVKERKFNETALKVAGFQAPFTGWFWAPDDTGILKKHQIVTWRYKTPSAM